MDNDHDSGANLTPFAKVASLVALAAVLGIGIRVVRRFRSR